MQQAVGQASVARPVAQEVLLGDPWIRQQQHYSVTWTLPRSGWATGSQSVGFAERGTCWAQAFSSLRFTQVNP